MTLQVQPKFFADALARVMGAVERNKEMPALSHVLMTSSGGYLTLRATDLSVEITTAIDCEGDLPPICAPADRLQAAISALTDRGIAEFRADLVQRLLIAIDQHHAGTLGDHRPRARQADA